MYKRKLTKDAILLIWKISLKFLPFYDIGRQVHFKLIRQT